MLCVCCAALACFFATTSAQRWDKTPEGHGRPLARISGLQSIDEARERGILGPEQWSDQVGVELLSTAAFNVHGTQVVQTSQGIMPAVLDELQPPLFRMTDRPRRLALLVEDMLEGYRPFLGYLVPSIAPVLAEFRKQNLPIFWTDRFNGVGVPALRHTNGVQNASAIMGELQPTKAEVAEGRVLRSTHLNKFADSDGGRSALGDWLQAMRVDTLVITGAWTESCVLATAMEAVDQRGLDVIVVSDGVGSATPSHFAALDVMAAGRLGLVASAREVAGYLQEHSGDRDYIEQPTFEGFEVVDGQDHLRVYVSVWAFAGAMTAVAAVSASVGAAFTVAAVRHRIARCKPNVLLDP